MRCTAKKTTKLIIESGNDYVITVKANQPRLSTQLKTIREGQQPCERFVEKWEKPRPVQLVESRVSSLTSVASTLIGLEQKASFKLNALVSAQKKNIYRPIITLAP